MTPKEVQAALNALAKEIGPRADVHGHVTENGKPCHGSVYPNGMAKDLAFSVSADDWPELIEGLNAKWREHRAEHERRIIRAMALEIIRLTAENGEATDAALRMKFANEDVARFGMEACCDADSIASNGPFCITKQAKANAA